MPSRLEARNAFVDVTTVRDAARVETIPLSAL